MLIKNTTKKSRMPELGQVARIQKVHLNQKINIGREKKQGFGNESVTAAGSDCHLFKLSLTNKELEC